MPRKTALLLDVKGVHTQAGEYKQNELQLAVDKTDITRAALTETLELGAERKRWLVFASGVEHAIHIADMLNSMGVSAIAIHSNLTTEQRDSAIQGFLTGRYRAAVNNNILTTGFDDPLIDLIVMLRPTQSTVLWVQMLGRGTRPAPGKENCLVLDFAGNTRRLGPINDPVLPRKKGEKGGEAPVKLCDVCQTYNHASVRNCVHCGAEFSFAVKIVTSASSDALLKDDTPQTDVFEVTQILYSVYAKIDRPPMLKVQYYCGLRTFTEYVCIEHDGFAQRMARKWWKERTAESFPESTLDAVEHLSSLAVPTHINVWLNKKYPEILAHCYDGTAFGKEQWTGKKPTVEYVPQRVEKPVESTTYSTKVSQAVADFLGDDIPF